MQLKYIHQQLSDLSCDTCDATPMTAHALLDKTKPNYKEAAT